MTYLMEIFCAVRPAKMLHHVILIVALIFGSMTCFGADESEEDPWDGSKGWPGSQEVAKKSNRAWWDQEKSDWPQWERGIL